VYDWSKRKLLNQFAIGSTPGFGLSSLHIVNQWQGGMILAGSADGIVRLYRNYDPTAGSGPTQLVSAFRVLSETVELRRGAGLVIDWRQEGGTLLAGGDSRVIKAWDAHTESALMDLDTNAEAPVCALASDPTNGARRRMPWFDHIVRIQAGCRMSNGIRSMQGSFTLRGRMICQCDIDVIWDANH
jgi:regulator-associated protein of mTOR